MIPKDGFDAAQPSLPLTDALFPKDDFLPSTDSYGASCFVESRLPEGLTSLLKADLKWGLRGIVRVQVGALRQFNVEIRLSPQDCDYQDEDLRGAHASIIGIRDRPNRRRIVAHLQAYVMRCPPADAPTP